MKKSILFVLAVALSLVPMAVFADEIGVTVDGVAVEFPGGRGAALVDGRTLVPVRGVFEMLGFYVDWDGDTRTTIITNSDYDVRITIDSEFFTLNGESHALDVSAQLIEGRTMVPIRLPLESVGHNLGWDEETRTVIITSSTDTAPQEPPPQPSPFGEPRVFTSPAITNLMAVAPHYTETRPEHPARAMTESERDAWIEEYLELGGMNAQELELYKIINEIRASYGLLPFYLCMRLSMASRLFSYLQVRYHTAGHDDRHYGGPGERANFFGIYGSVMENSNSERWYYERYTGVHLGYVYKSPQELVDGWMSSPLHREHILTTYTTHIGFGVDSGRDRVVPTMKTALPIDTDQFRASEITLPNRRLSLDERRQWIDEYNAMGGASDFERETIALINAARAEVGLDPLQINDAMMLSARFYVQTLINLNLPHGFDVGPYGGIGETVAAFGGRWNFANMYAGMWTPQRIIESIMESPDRRDIILDADKTHIGLGSYMGGEHGVLHILLIR